MRFRFAVLAALAVGTSCAGHAHADEPGDEKARAADFLNLARHEVESYRFASNIPGVEIVGHSEPILKWSNPVVGSIHGGVYLWTSHGRPEVVASIHRWYSPFTHGGHEFHSLSLGTIVASRDGVPVWTTGRPGVELNALPEAPEPATTAAQRLRQMRDLAKEFSARQTDRKNIDRDLRLLAQPIYRYEALEGELMDGGLFVFVLGTDPEVFLLLEARKIGETPLWQYALARMNSVSLRVSYRGREVWNVPTLPWSEVYDHQHPYTNFRIDRTEAGKPAAP